MKTTKKLGAVLMLVIMVMAVSGCQKAADRIETAGDEFKNSISNSYKEEMSEENRKELEEQGESEEPNETEGENAEETDTNSVGAVVEEKRPVTVAFTGDVLFSDGILANYDRNGLGGILDQRLIDELNSADITVINNEFPFSERGTQAEDKQYTFRISPDRVHILQEMGVDMASLANNHSLDFGVEAMLDTIDTLKGAGIIPLGAGGNSTEAKEIAYMEKEGMTFAFLAASRVIPVPEWTAGKNPGLLTTYDPTMLLEQIGEAGANADFVIVYVHWGLEKENYPEDYQRSLGQSYIDAGADLVVGSHSHCLQGIEYYKDVPIVYSLGNFVFGSQIPSTVLLKATFEEKEKPVLSVVPATGVDFYTSAITEEDKLQEFYDFYEEISFGVTFEDGVLMKK